MNGRPILRYHGGKWKLAPWIIENMPPHRIYVEPFGGAASVLLRKPRTYAEVYNDLDGEVVNVFRVMRSPGASAILHEALQLTPFSREEFIASYGDNSGKDAVERARLTIIKSFMGFGSNSLRDSHTPGKASTGFRSNSSRSGTTPAADWRNFPSHVPTFLERLQGVVIECRPAVEVMQQHDREDCLHYVDPPYSLSTRDKGTDYRHEMNEEDHRELAAVLRSLRGMVMISGYACDLYDSELFSDWLRLERSHYADGARSRTEVIWLNPAAARSNLRLFNQHSTINQGETAHASEAR